MTQNDKEEIIKEMKNHLYFDPKKNSVDYGEWLRENCMVSRNGWISSSVPRKWEGEKTNEQAYEMYLESLK